MLDGGTQADTGPMRWVFPDRYRLEIPYAWLTGKISKSLITWVCGMENGAAIDLFNFKERLEKFRLHLILDSKREPPTQIRECCERCISCSYNNSVAFPSDNKSFWALQDSSSAILVLMRHGLESKCNDFIVFWWFSWVFAKLVLEGYLMKSNKTKTQLF